MLEIFPFRINCNGNFLFTCINIIVMLNFSSLKGFEPRQYQLDAAQSVIEKGNTLVVMPTALGKTYVALLVLAKKLADNPNNRALFLAPTKPLASQQFKKIQETLAEVLNLKFQNQENNSRLKLLQQNLADYMRAEGLGRLFNDNGYVTRAVKSSPVYDFTLIKPILESLGRWHEILKIDDRKFEKLSASLPIDLQTKIKEATTGIKERETITARRKARLA